VIKLTFDLSLKGASVQVVHGSRSPVVYLIKPGWSVSKKIGQAEEVVSMQPDRSVVILTPFGHLTATETSPYGSVLGELFSCRNFPRSGQAESGDWRRVGQPARVAILCSTPVP
jgi:hypothetical protein